MILEEFSRESLRFLGGVSPSGAPLLPRTLPQAEAGSAAARLLPPSGTGDRSAPSAAAASAAAAGALSGAAAASGALPPAACALVEGLSQMPRVTNVSKASAKPRRCGCAACAGAAAGVPSSSATTRGAYAAHMSRYARFKMASDMLAQSLAVLVFLQACQSALFYL